MRGGWLAGWLAGWLGGRMDGWVEQVRRIRMVVSGGVQGCGEGAVVVG